MPTETELKLKIDPASLKALLASDLFNGEPEVVEQNAVYFDTPEHALRKAGFSLRIRSAGNVRTQTVKATTSATAGIFARDEWEQVVEDDTPVLDHSTHLLNQIGDDANRLEPLFEIAVERRKWSVFEGGAEIEVSLDRGFVKAADRQVPLCEMELELKSGGVAWLFEFARKIDGVIPFKFEVLTKGERGYRLLEQARTVFKAEPLELDRTASVASVFREIALTCFRQFRLNEASLLNRRNPESLHQARVALRRFRSAFSTFGFFLRDAESERLKGDLKWLAALLGDARNIDVMLIDAKDETRSRLFEERTHTYDAVIDALTSQRARSLMIDLNRWLHCGEWLTSPATAEARGMSAADIAAKALDRHRRKLKKHADGFSKTDDEHRHEVRKDAKKLRYAAEFFRTLFDGKKAKRRHRRFIELMENLQDVLGSLNDLATRPQVLEKMGLPAETMPTDKRSKDKLLLSAEDALDDLLEAKRFWR